MAADEVETRFGAVTTGPERELASQQELPFVGSWRFS